MLRTTASLSRLAARVLCTLALMLASATLALASPGTLYMNGGLTTPAGAIVANGQLWVSDSTLGFCRVAPNANGVQLIIGSTCFSAGTSQAAYDPVNNVAYVGDLAGKSGVWRLNFDATSQNILNAVDIVPGTSVQNSVPVGVALGPDGKLYVGFRASDSIIRITNPTNDTPGAQVIEQVGLLQAGRGVNALAFRGNDLWVADRNFIDHMDNATLCTGGCTAIVVGGTTAIPNGIVSDGTRYVYIAVGAAVIRYDGTTGVFDTLTTSATDFAGLPVNYGFVWGLGYRASDGTVFITTDVFGPAAAGAGRRGAPGGPPPGTGSIFKLSKPFTGEGAVIDPLTLQAMALTGPFAPPNVPLTPAASSYVTGVTAPRGMAMIDGHLWVSDRFVGLCRVDVNVSGQASLSNVCAPGTTGAFIPGQPVATFTTNPVTGVKTVNHVFVPDLAQTSQGVWRFDYNPVTQSLSNPITALSGLNRPSSLALGSDGNLYIGFFGLNQVNRILTPDTNPTLDKGVGTTVDGGGVRSIAFVNNDLYLAETSNVTLVPLATSRSKPIQAIRFGDTPGVTVKGFVSRLTQGGALALASDGTDKLYMGVPVDVQAFSVSVPQQYDLANRGFDGTNETPFVNATALAWDSANTLYVAEDSQGLNAPQSGHIWAVTLPWNKPLVPSYLQAVTVTDGSVQLKWHDWSTSETNFTIQRQTVPADGSAPAPFADLVNLVSDTLGTTVGNDFYTDTTVTPGTTYNYQIMASGPDGNSPYTVPGATATVSKFPAAPDGLSAHVVSDAEVDLSWNDNSFSETGFRVERALDAAFTTGKTSFTAPADSIALSDTTTAGNTTYYYRVIAFNANGDGQASDLVSVTTPLATQPPTITNPGNQSGVEAQAASLQMVAADYAGGHNPLTFSATGLPAGLTINTATGLISGTPTLYGTYNVDVQVYNGNLTADAQFTWTIKPFPTSVSVSPTGGAGTNQTFTFVYSDNAGFARLNPVYLLFNSSLNWAGGCGGNYNQSTNTFSLNNDAGTTFTPGVLGQAGTLANSQCSINLAASSASGAGSTLTLQLAVTFSPSFFNTKTIWMRASDPVAGIFAQNVVKGSWTPALPPTPQPVSVTPGSGTGLTQTFAMAYSDAAGFQRVTNATMFVNSTQSATGSCGGVYTQSTNLFQIYQDNGVLAPGVALGQASVVQNSQCSINLANSSASGTGTTLTLRLAVTFKPSFGGLKKIWMQAQDTVYAKSSAVQSLGTWTGSPATLSLVGASPNTGGAPAGTAQLFTFTVSDTAGGANISSTRMVVNTSLQWLNACGGLYDGNAKTFQFPVNGTLQSGVKLGVAGTVSNEVCTIDLGQSSAVVTGNNLVVTLAMTFKTTVPKGSRTIWMLSQDGANNLLAPYTVEGTWNVQ
jgi:hypothetical protein